MRSLWNLLRAVLSRDYPRLSVGFIRALDVTVLLWMPFVTPCFNPLTRTFIPPGGGVAGQEECTRAPPVPGGFPCGPGPSLPAGFRQARFILGGLSGGFVLPPAHLRRSSEREGKLVPPSARRGFRGRISDTPRCRALDVRRRQRHRARRAGRLPRSGLFQGFLQPGASLERTAEKKDPRRVGGGRG